MQKNNIAWMLPAVLEGSGGHRTIFNKINTLQKNGFNNDIYFYSLHESELPGAIENLERFFEVNVSKIFPGHALQNDYLVSIATLWDGARLVAYHNTPYKIHFIQDYEAMFNPMGDGYLLAENAYTYDITPIVLGRWLWKMMSYFYDKKSFLCDFGVDKDIYYSREDNPVREKSVCFIFQPEKPRRAHRIGIEALGIVKNEMPDVKIYFYGSSQDINIWYGIENLKLLKPEELGDFYRRCGVGLCLSTSNPSRVPFEMMACGLPVVDLYRSNNLYDYTDNSIYLAHQSPESIASAIIDILQSKKASRNLSQGGIVLTRDQGIEKEEADFLNAFKNIISNKSPEIENLKISYQRDAAIAPALRTKSLQAFLARQKTMLNLL